MNYLRSFCRFWYDFVIGDDWTLAAGVVVALAFTAVLAHLRVAAWWLLPIAFVGLLSLSLIRATRTARRGR
jgi:hypothetical protein